MPAVNPLERGDGDGKHETWRLSGSIAVEILSDESTLPCEISSTLIQIISLDLSVASQRRFRPGPPPGRGGIGGSPEDEINFAMLYNTQQRRTI
jgi:hypothetical protein